MFDAVKNIGYLCTFINSSALCSGSLVWAIHAKSTLEIDDICIDEGPRMLSKLSLMGVGCQEVV